MNGTGDVRFSRAKGDSNGTLKGGKLRAELEDGNEPLPDRWIDLIRRLDKKEKSNHSPAHPLRRSNEE
jgi:hypothetical protein